MAELKTKPTDASVEDFIAGVDLEVLEELVRTSVEKLRRTYPE